MFTNPIGAANAGESVHKASSSLAALPVKLEHCRWHHRVHHAQEPIWHVDLLPPASLPSPQQANDRVTAEISSHQNSLCTVSFGHSTKWVKLTRRTLAFWSCTPKNLSFSNSKLYKQRKKHIGFWWSTFRWTSGDSLTKMTINVPPPYHIRQKIYEFCRIGG